MVIPCEEARRVINSSGITTDMMLGSCSRAGREVVSLDNNRFRAVPGFLRVLGIFDHLPDPSMAEMMQQGHEVSHPVTPPALCLPGVIGRI